MNDIEHARAAKVALSHMLNRPSWLRGMGVSQTQDKFCVKVLVAKINDEVRAAVPATLGDVPVVLEEADEFTPL